MRALSSTAPVYVTGDIQTKCIKRHRCTSSGSTLVAIHIFYAKNCILSRALILFYGNLSAIFHFLRRANCNRCVILFYFIVFSGFFFFTAFCYSFGNFHFAIPLCKSTNGYTYKMYCARALFIHMQLCMEYILCASRVGNAVVKSK